MISTKERKKEIQTARKKAKKKEIETMRKKGRNECGAKIPTSYFVKSLSQYTYRQN